jgi:hypothetical protein
MKMKMLEKLMDKVDQFSWKLKGRWASWERYANESDIPDSVAEALDFTLRRFWHQEARGYAEALNRLALEPTEDNSRRVRAHVFPRLVAVSNWLSGEDWSAEDIAEMVIQRTKRRSGGH